MTTSSAEATTTKCTSKGWFGRCTDGTPITATPAAEGYAYYRTAPTTVQTAP